MTRSAVIKFPILEASALVITVFVLAGWQPASRAPLMSMATAVMFIIAIASKILFEYSDSNKKLLLISRTLALCTLLAGLTRIVSAVFSISAIDNLFSVEHPGGTEIFLVLVTGFTFILLGTALYRITLYNAEKIFFPHLLSVISAFIALVSVIAYFFSSDTFYGFRVYKPMGISTAINFLLLSLSILMVNSRKGFMENITGEYQGARIARLLLPICIALPILLGFFQLQTEKTDFYTFPYNVALITLARIIILVLFIWRVAVVINRSNKAQVAEVEHRKKDAEVLQYRKALLEAQKESIPDAILVVDHKGQILSYNHHFVEMWNIPDNILQAGDDEAALQFAMNQLSEPQKFVDRVEYLYAHPEENAHDELTFIDGRIIERFGNQVMGDDGTVYGWAWYFRDITIRKNYEDNIKHFNRELEKKVSERTDQLDKSEKRFRLLVENSSDIISLIDFEGKIIYISPSVQRLTGFTEQEMIGRSGFDLIHSGDREGAENLRKSLLDKPGIPEKSIFRLLHRSGESVWLEGTTTNMLNDENVNAFVLNYHDITERKKAEEKIYKSEKRFRSLIENAQDIISLSDKDGKRFYISPAIERITGYTVEETSSHEVFDIVHPDDVPKTKKLRLELIKEPGMIQPISFRYIKKDGGIVWMEGTIVNLLEDENVKAVVGNFHDVTERMISEEKIRETNERFEMVSRATNDAVWDWNLQSDKIYWNDEVKSMFDYCADDIASGTEWKIHIHPEDFKRVTRKMVYHIKNRIQNWQDEYRFRCADGSYKYVFNRGFILFDNDNKPYRIIGAMQDVTEINKLQQSLNEERIKKQKELTNATIEGQEKERADIGKELHDNVNQLLTATKLFLDVAASQPAMKDEMIKRSTDNLSICMEEIRRLSSTLVPPLVALNSFEEIMQDLVEPIKLATKINVEYRLNTASKNSLSAHQQLNMYRIIQEHLTNIVKHSKADNVLINVQQLNGHIDLTIKDDGQGFNTAARRKGIGFKNIQSRAELLDGKMEIISKPGKGCLLIVNFPLSAENKAVPAS